MLLQTLLAPFTLTAPALLLSPSSLAADEEEEEEEEEVSQFCHPRSLGRFFCPFSFFLFFFFFLLLFLS